MLVVSRRDNEYILVIRLLDGAQQLLAALHLLQTLLRHTQRKIDDFAVPYIHRPAQSADDDFDLAIALRPEHVSGIQANARGDGQQDVRDGGAMRRALMALVGQGFRLLGGEDAALNGMEDRSALAELFFEKIALDAAVKDAHGDAFAGSLRMMQQALRRQQGEYVREDIARGVVGRWIGHGRVSPVISSSN